jgi:hypothetical protein
MLCYAMLCCAPVERSPQLVWVRWIREKSLVLKNSNSWSSSSLPASLLTKLRRSQYQAIEMGAAICQWGGHATREQFLRCFPSCALRWQICRRGVWWTVLKYERGLCALFSVMKYFHRKTSILLEWFIQYFLGYVTTNFKMYIASLSNLHHFQQ